MHYNIRTYVIIELFTARYARVAKIITSAKEVMFLPVFVCLSVCKQDNLKSYGQIFLKFWGYVGRGINYQ